ncbi:MAG: 16S rRNA (cytosine(967)-C(5))-methyltransferase RsmB [Nitrospirales bacterium]
MPSPSNPRKFACKVLQTIYRSQGFADDVFDAAIKEAVLSNQDRALAFEMVYGVLRHALTLDWRLDQISRKPLARLPLNVATILRVAAYQLLYLDRVPDSAAVNEAVKLTRKQPGHDWGGLVNAILRNLIRQSDPLLPDIHIDPVHALSIRYSCPSWMVERWIKTFGIDQAEVLCRKTLEIPPMTLRTNTLRCTRQGLLDRLETEGVPAKVTSVSSLGVTLEKCGHPGHLSVVQDGWCYIEDEAGQLIPPLLDPQPGERILEACAAPGGKTTHLAQLMQNQGTIIALDRQRERLIRLIDNCQRLGIEIVQTYERDAATDAPTSTPTCHDSPSPVARALMEPFDRILVDAPCSGLGILRRHPEGKMLKQFSTIEQSRHIQQQILDRVCTLLRPGGILVYSACSIEPEETTEVVSAFCQEHPEFQPEPITPWMANAGLSLVTDLGHLCTAFQSFTMDGFFACRLKKTDVQ